MEKDLLAQAENMSKLAPSLKRVAGIDARLVAIRDEERSKTRGPLPKAELTERLVAALRGIRDRFEMRDAASTYDLTAAEIVNTADPASLLVMARRTSPGDDTLALLVWLLGPELEKAIPAAVKRLDYEPVSPLTSAERRALVERLQVERAELVAERRGLVEDLNEGGIRVDHLEETRREIADEEARARNDAERAARNASRARAVDTRVADLSDREVI